MKQLFKNKMRLNMSSSMNKSCLRGLHVLTHSDLVTNICVTIYACGCELFFLSPVHVMAYFLYAWHRVITWTKTGLLLSVRQTSVKFPSTLKHSKRTGIWNCRLPNVSQFVSSSKDSGHASSKRFNFLLPSTRCPTPGVGFAQQVRLDTRYKYTRKYHQIRNLYCFFFTSQWRHN